MNNIMVLFSLLEQKGLLPALIPSTIFVPLTLFVLNPFLKLTSSAQQQELVAPLVVLSVILLTLIIIVSYTLTALNTFILKIFEGYFTIPFLSYMGRKIQLNKALRQMEYRDKLKSEIIQLEDRGENRPEIQQKLRILRDQHYHAATYCSLMFPEDLSGILPTRFGNILKAAENYSGERYGFDGVTLWPRLVQVIPAEYKSSIDNTRNELSFFVNMSFFSVSFALICFVAFLYSIWIDDFGKIYQYLLGMFIGFISFSFFYNVSINSVISFGSMIRSSFDLFRLDLLKKLGLPRPKDSIEEFNMWNNINELITLGRHSLTFRKLDYRNEESYMSRTGTSPDGIQFTNITYPNPEIEHFPTDNPIQFDLGGVTLNMGEIMKEIMALLKAELPIRQVQKKNKKAKRTTSKERKKSNIKSKAVQKTPDR